MKLSRKQLKHLVKQPSIRPHVHTSLKQFDANINAEQNAKLADKQHTSKTFALLSYLVKFDHQSDHSFCIPKTDIQKAVVLDHRSLDFNFAALHQLKLVKIDWDFYKTHHDVKGQLNATRVY